MTTKKQHFGYKLCRALLYLDVSLTLVMWSQLLHFFLIHDVYTCTNAVKHARSDAYWLIIVHVIVRSGILLLSARRVLRSCFCLSWFCEIYFPALCDRVLVLSPPCPVIGLCSEFICWFSSSLYSFIVSRSEVLIVLVLGARWFSGGLLVQVLPLPCVHGAYMLSLCFWGFLRLFQFPPQSLCWLAFPNCL